MSAGHEDAKHILLGPTGKKYGGQNTMHRNTYKNTGQHLDRIKCKWKIK
jgi:hypothetical protein